MPIGTSDGDYYENPINYALKKLSDGDLVDLLATARTEDEPRNTPSGNYIAAPHITGAEKGYYQEQPIPAWEGEKIRQKYQMDPGAALNESAKEHPFPKDARLPMSPAVMMKVNELSGVY